MSRKSGSKRQTQKTSTSAAEDHIQQESVELAIADARRRGAKELYLSAFGLTTVPLEVWSLPELDTLNLSRNSIRKVATQSQ